MLVDYNTHVHALSKKIFFFLNFIIIHENKGGAMSPSAKKTHFFGLTEISGQLCGRGPQKLAEWNFVAELTTICRGFKFEPKTKKL